MISFLDPEREGDHVSINKIGIISLDFKSIRDGHSNRDKKKHPACADWMLLESVFIS
jgi:hypothetical protein